ncbi:uncharacterized protein LOC133460187 [Cololabis saira]|uniref:uncharacterized protein LOC133460187 n=1 Tax=Cololabis saira TaxID=129043 RepID=UPI002AD4F0AF|nr:uncharacterized protein LOC133460187 [Cololabis saira]
MDLKDSLVNGGVLIVHQTNDGKHHYEVENVVKYKKDNGKKMFVRRGDKIMEINGINVQVLTPDELAQKLSEGSPVLTVYNACRKPKDVEKLDPQEDTLRPVSKELTTMSFSWEMTREEEDNEVPQELEEGEKNGDEDDVCQDTVDSGEGKELLVIEMTKTSISLLRGRGCDTQNPCEACHGAGCAINEIVVVTESSTVTLVPRGSGSISFTQLKLSEALIRNELTHRYLRGISEKELCSSPNPEKITIYYYKSNSLQRPYRGMPVVLNFTESNCFIRCCKNGDKVLLQLEACEKQKLRQISQSDKNALAFVFYMKSDQTNQRKFESALHQGWFMRIIHTDLVEMETLDGGREDPSFLFVIQK